MSISKLPTNASLKQVMDKFEEISLQDFSSIDIITAPTLPTTGKEGQMCIITDIVPSNIYFDYKKPLLSDTDIFIKYSNEEAHTTFNIKSSNKKVRLKFNTIIQFHNNCENVLVGYIYINGKWCRVSPEEFYIFKANVGLDNSIKFNSSITSTSQTITYDVNTSRMNFTYTGNNGVAVTGKIYTENIDMSNYKFLHIDFYATSNISWNKPGSTVSVKILDNNGACVAYKTINYECTNDSSSNPKWEIFRNWHIIDISKLIGNYTLSIEGYMYNTYAEKAKGDVSIYNLLLGGEVINENIY